MSDNVLQEQLLALLGGRNAHMGFEDAIKDFPEEYINRKASHVSYTFWHLLEHMRIAQWDILEFVRDPDHVTPDWPDNFWPPKNKKADLSQWNKTIEDIRSDLAAVEKIIKDPDTDFFGPIPHAPDYNIFREILLVADHNAYHVGEFLTLRQVMGIKPPDSW
jgi:hypothetical protein